MKRGINGREALMVEIRPINNDYLTVGVNKVGPRISAYMLGMEEVEHLTVNEIAALMGNSVKEAVRFDLRDSDESYVQAEGDA